MSHWSKKLCKMKKRKNCPVCYFCVFVPHSPNCHSGVRSAVKSLRAARPLGAIFIPQSRASHPPCFTTFTSNRPQKQFSHASCLASGSTDTRGEMSAEKAVPEKVDNLLKSTRRMPVGQRPPSPQIYVGVRLGSNKIHCPSKCCDLVLQHVSRNCHDNNSGCQQRFKNTGNQ